MALNKTLLAAQGLRCSEERFWGKSGGGGGLGLCSFLGFLTAHLEYVNAASDLLQEIKTS